MTKASFVGRGRSALVGLAALATAASVVLVGITPSGASTRHADARPLTSTAPGTLIADHTVPTTGVTGAAAIYLIEYYSETVQGSPVKVTGLVFVPTGTAPAGGWPVVSWAHPTDGTNKTCAPSLYPATDVPNIDALLAKHWEVVATDYQGEANSHILDTSPGLLPYLVGTSAARNTIDIVRAAGHLAAAHAGKNYVVWGWSEGGQTVMFVLDMARTYGSGLDLKGALAMAPPSNLGTELPYAEDSSTNWPLLFLAVGGFNAAYGSTLAPTAPMLTATGQGYLGLLGTQCLDVVAGTLLVYSSFTKIFKIPRGGALSTLPAKWRTLVHENDPAGTANLALTDTSVPLVIAGGSLDTTVDPVTTADLATEMCALSTPQNLRRWVYTGLTHDDIDGPASIDDYVAWTADRFAGSGSYTPKGTTTNPAAVTNSCG